MFSSFFFRHIINILIWVNKLSKRIKKSSCVKTQVAYRPYRILSVVCPGWRGGGCGHGRGGVGGPVLARMDDAGARWGYPVLVMAGGWGGGRVGVPCPGHGRGTPPPLELTK